MLNENLKIRFFFFAFLTLILSLSSGSFAANRYWVGSPGGNWANNANWSTTSGGAGGASYPVSTDVAIIDGGGNNNMTIAATATVLGISISSTYSGTITQSANVTITTSSFSQAGGTWNGSTYSMDINDGGFTLSGGTFNQPTGSFTIERGFTVSGGTYSGASDEIIFDGTNSSDNTPITCTGNLLSITGASTVTFSKTSTGLITINSGCEVDAMVTNSSNAAYSTISISSGATLISLSDFYSQSVTVSGYLETAAATFNVGGTVGGTGLTINPGGIANLNTATTFDINGGGVTVSASGSLTAAPSTLYIETDLSILGTFNVTGKNIVFDGGHSTDDTSINCIGNYNSLLGISSLTFNKAHDAADITIGSGCSATATMTNSSTGVDGAVTISAGGSLTTTGAFYALSLNVSGYLQTAASTFVVGGTSNTSFLTVNSGGTANLSASTSFDINNGGVTVASGGFMSTGATLLTIEQNLTINGTFDISGKALVFNGQHPTDDTTITCTGNYNSLLGITSLKFDKGDSGAAVALSSGCTATAAVTNGYDLSSFGNHGILTINASATLYTTGYFYAHTLTVNGYLVADASTFDIGNTTSSGGVSVGSGGHADLSSVTTFDINDAGLTVSASGTVTFPAAAMILSIETNLTNSGSIINLSNKTITFDGADDANDSTYTNTSTVAGITVNKTHATGNFTLGSNAIVSGDFTRTDGPVTNPASGYSLYIGGNLSMSTTDAFGGANMTVEFNGTGTQTISQNAANTFNPVMKINKSSGETQLSTNVTQSTAACNIVEGTFNINNKTFVCGGAFTVEDGGILKRSGLETFTTTGGLTLNSGSTVIYTGDGDGAADTVTVTTMSSNYHHLTINSTDGTTDTFQLGAAIDMNGNFTLSNGAFDVTATPRNMTVGGNWAFNGGTFNARTGTVTFDTTTTSVISGNTTFYNFTSTTSNKQINFTAGSTQTISNAFTLTGTAGNLITLRSSTTGTFWNINSAGTESVSYVDVKDSNASSGTEIAAANSTNTGWNPNWSFGVGSPYAPVDLGPTNYVDGSLSTDSSPTLTFTIDDQDNETVQYRIQIDDTSSFVSPVVDYTSAVAAEGTRSFTVGQAVGTGSYTTGSADQHLPNGSYYWRVQAIDNSANVSGQATANSGSIAFVIRPFTVSKTADTNDGSCDADCSLREAITAVNADGSSPRYIYFNIPGATDGGCSGASGVCTIAPASALPAISAGNVTLDGYTQSGASVNTTTTGALDTSLKIQIDGTSAGAASYGIDITSGSNLIRGFSVYNFRKRGIYIHNAGTGNKVQGNFVGVMANGITTAKNYEGGIYVVTTNSHYIGTDGDGVNDASERNLVSGNGTVTTDPAVSVSSGTGTSVSGNIIGLNSGCTADIGNIGSGIYLGTTGHRIGTNADGTSDDVERNVISGNGSYGISIAAGSNSVFGNYVGTNCSGYSSFGNDGSGIYISSGTGTYIGTNGDGINDSIEGNLVSGGGSRGIYLSAGSSNYVSGNIIGLNAGGTAALANTLEGIRIDSGSNIIGTNDDGTSDSTERNIISGNSNDGIRLSTASASGNIISGNYIGVASDATTDMGNGRHGVSFDASSANNTLGGNSLSETNIIAYNGNAASEYGIYLTGAASDGNDILRNVLYSNQNEGIKLAGDGANNNISRPTITSTATSATTNVTFSGTTSSAGDTVELFDASSDSEGQTWLGNTTADGSGNWSITIANSSYSDLGNTLVATTTDSTDGTSEFSTLYTISTTAPPTPTTLGPTGYVDGSNTTDTTPTVTFTLPADADGDSVKYQIQFDDSSDFSSPIIDYTSGLDTSGAKSFTVGQAVGSGTYTTGSIYTRLPYGNIYWRVKNLDIYNSASSYATANSGGVAFVERIYSVTKTADTSDGTCNTDCSLREAITAANANATYYTIEFGIDPDLDSGCNSSTDVCTIFPTSNLTTITRTGLSINGYSQYGSTATTQNFPSAIDAVIKIGIDGSSAGVGGDGITINANSVTVQGLSIYNFNSNSASYGICAPNLGSGSDLKIQGNFIGVKPDGTTEDANYYGVLVQGATYTNIIVGTDGDGTNDAAERNLISGNERDGISLLPGGTARISGNFIGTNITGLSALPNDMTGVLAGDGTITIGTNGDGINDSYEGNLISGNLDGIQVATTETSVAGNYIGVDRTGLSALPNTSDGIYLAWEGSFIGTNGDGTSDSYERNIISGNTSTGIYSVFTSFTNEWGYIKGNYIGLGSNGTTAVANSGDGINISTISENYLIGTNGDGLYDAAESNYISGNTGDGIEIGDKNNIVAGNYIGIDAAGSDKGNSQHGIFLNGAGADYVVIGGDATSEANTIAYNGDAASEYGIYLNNTGTDGNLILRNALYNNQNEGIKLVSGANNDKSAPTFTGASANGSFVTMSGTSAASNTVQIFDADSDNQEGQVFLASVTANGAGNWTADISGVYTTTGNNLVATASDSTGSNGTSQFTSAYAVPNVAPTPSNLGPTAYVNGSSGDDTTPTLTFDVTDSNYGDTTGYRIQIDDTADFSSVVVDYQGTYDAASSKSFTVGQAAGTGSYNTGSSGQILHYGDYFWRVQGTDNNGGVSSYVTAAGGGTAFHVNVLTVTVTADSTDNSCDASCSLRDAITVSNTTTTADTINFNIPSSDTGCNGSGVCTINITGSALPTITNSAVIINGYTQTGATVNTQNYPAALDAVIKIGLSGSNLSSGEYGLTINTSNTTIKGLSIYDFPSHGIFITDTVGNSGSKIYGNFIGAKPDGDTVDGNGASGIRLAGTNVTDTFIGTNGDGSNDASERNLISGNANHGIYSSGLVTVSGNFIGTDKDGTADLGNGQIGISCADGEITVGTDGNGTADSIEGNVVSGNNSHGIEIGSSCNPAVISGNIIGLNRLGSSALGNTSDGINGAGGVIDQLRVGTNADGTSDSYERNIISGNSGNGIAMGVIINSSIVAGNYIGTDLTGLIDLGNSSAGIFCWGCTSTSYLGTNGDGVGDALESNVVSGNNNKGINIFQGTPNIRGNYIGLGSNGTTSIGNSSNGVHLDAVPNSFGTNSDGTSDALEGNYISNSGDHGIYVTWFLSGLVFKGNKIGINTAGSDAGNAGHGIFFDTWGMGGDNCVFGGTGPYDGNIIAYNGDAGAEYGVYFDSGDNDNNQFIGNSFYNNQNIAFNFPAGGNNDKASPNFVSTAANGTYKDISGTASAGDSIQVYDADSDNEEGQTLITTVTADGSGNWTATIPSPYSAKFNIILGLATDGTNGTSKFSAGYTIPNAPPSVSNLGPTSYVNGSTITDSTPTLTFDVADADIGDTVGYRIQIDDNSDFSSVVVDYEGTYAATGSRTFTVGQATGTGLYNTGAAGQKLHRGSFFWRVRAMDNDGGTSSYVSANSGGTAFGVNVITVNVSSDADDSTCDQNCSLREAINDANTIGGNIGIEFGILSTDTGCTGSGLCKISATNSLPSITTDDVTINGYTQTGASANTTDFPNALNAVIQIEIDGSAAGAGKTGLTISANDAVIKGLNINGFTSHGININGVYTGNKIQGCFIGTDPTGELDRGNTSYGINITNADQNTIGTDGDGSNDASERNLISGNNVNGIYITTNATTNEIKGNFIGTDKDGTVDLGNTQEGITLQSTLNIVGTDSDGNYDTYEGNLISGNDRYGVYITGASADANSVKGNIIGLKATGITALPNTNHAVRVDTSSDSNVIGTDGNGTNDANERNYISGNSADGIINAGDSTIIAGNYIGLGTNGTTIIGNSSEGITLYGAASSCRIGTNADGTADALEANVIVGNVIGISIQDTSTTSNTVAGNFIGIVPSSSLNGGNIGHGISISNGATNNTIGGASALQSNHIANNSNAGSASGINVAGASTDGNIFYGNSIYENDSIGINLDGAGANNNEAAPVISAESCSGTNINIIGTAGASRTIQLFDADINDQEGQTYIGEGYSDASGNWRIKIPGSQGTVVATATDNTNGTSEFSSSYFPISTCIHRRRIIILKKQNMQ